MSTKPAKKTTRKKAAPKKPDHPVHKYAKNVVSGKILAGRLVRLSCERHLRDLKEGKKRGIYFDEKAANRIINYFKMTRHYKGDVAGQPFVLEPWQMFLVGSLFGWKRKDGLRRFRKAYIEVPRKNGKSPLTAMISTYLAFFDNEPGAEVYCVATKEKQARIVFNDAVQFVKNAHPLVKDKIKFTGRSHITNMYCDKSVSKFEALGSDSETLDGLNIHGAIIDEFHAHKTKRLYDVLDSGMGSRKQPMLIMITTAGFNLNSPCYETRNYAASLVEGLFGFSKDDDHFFSYISTIDEGDDIFDELTWQKANPNWGVSVKPEYFRNMANQARKNRSTMGNFLTKLLNIWTDQYSSFFDMDNFELCRIEVVLDELKGQRCFGGIDLAKRIDLSAFALYFPDASPLPVVIVWFWMPRDTLETEYAQSQVPYQRWVDEGHIFVTEGAVTNYDILIDFIAEKNEDFDIVEIGFDAHNATHMMTKVEAIGIDIKEVPQNKKIFTPILRESEALIASKSINFDNNPVLKWCFSNTVVHEDGNGNIKPMKDKSKDKIDGVIAYGNALGCEMGHEEEAPTESIYETRGPTVIG